MDGLEERVKINEDNAIGLWRAVELDDPEPIAVEVFYCKSCGKPYEYPKFLQCPFCKKLKEKGEKPKPWILWENPNVALNADISEPLLELNKEVAVCCPSCNKDFKVGIKFITDMVFTVNKEEEKSETPSKSVTEYHGKIEVNGHIWEPSDEGGLYFDNKEKKISFYHFPEHITASLLCDSCGKTSSVYINMDDTPTAIHCPHCAKPYSINEEGEIGEFKPLVDPNNPHGIYPIKITRDPDWKTITEYRWQGSFDEDTPSKEK